MAPKAGINLTPEEHRILEGWESHDDRVGSSFQLREWLTEASAHVTQHIGPAHVTPTIEEFAEAIRNGDADKMRQRMAQARLNAKLLLTLGQYYGYLLSMMERDRVEVHDGPDGPVLLTAYDSRTDDDTPKGHPRSSRRHGSVRMVLEHSLPDREFTMWEHASRPGTFNAKCRLRLGWGYREEHEYMLWDFSMDQWDEVFAHGKAWVITGSIPVEIRQVDNARYRANNALGNIWWKDEEAAA